MFDTAGCRYEIIAGNYEQKFSIDEQSGVISVVEPLQGLSKGRAQRALAEVDPIITLQVSTLSPRLVPGDACIHLTLVTAGPGV